MNTRRSKEGDVLFKAIEIVTVMPDGKRFRRVLKAPPGKGLTEIHRENILADFAGKLEQSFPGVEFKLLPIAGGRQFNFVAQKPEAIAA